MHITPVLLKNYSSHNFLNRSNFAFFCFFSKKNFSPQKMFMSCLCLRHGTYLNSTSNVFAYLLIIFLGRAWFWFFLNEHTSDPLHNNILAWVTPLNSN